MTAPLTDVAPPPARWPAWRRLLLNFGTLYLTLYFLVGGQTFLDSAEPLRMGRFQAADALHRVLFGSSLFSFPLTGSGDTSVDWMLVLLVLLVSVVGGVLWTGLQNNRGPHRVHLTGLVLGVRLMLGAWLAVYGLAKFNFGQFGLLMPSQLETTYGESSPMGLLWRFMAASPGYQLLGGVAEMLPAVLLLHRRTITLGALIAAITMTNVLALNLSYDVPVKLFSAHLLLAAVVLLAYDHERLTAFLTGRALPALAWPRRPRLNAVIAWVFTALLVGATGVQLLNGMKILETDRQNVETSSSLLKTRGFHLVNERPFNR